MQLKLFVRNMLLKAVGMQDVEHPAGFPMAGHYGQTAISVTLFICIAHPGGVKCHFTSFPSPVTDDTQQSHNQEKQERKQ